ncbi:hypothetical protein B0J11DRAFT_542388 [Dendryphion nanum]|uniref:G-patch domain-containing protein n=1 Tax=Dendryphion nanum TaxID=256645 RepID=A0A9P9D4R8_9PLEO|nr:hypothetical protein B0J11DRAFT_542388 [Dendryphion nanum]
MDANAYLKRQGWRGSGHSLDRTDRGIKKPLLIAHKQDQLGLGKKKQFVDDQWWMRAFDESLQSIGTGKKSTLDNIREQGVSRGGLYSFFVKGEGLVGTISTAEDSSAAETSHSNSSASPSRESTPATSAAESPSDRDDGSDRIVAATTNSRKRSRKESTRETCKRRKVDKSDGILGVDIAANREGKKAKSEASRTTEVKRQEKKAAQSEGSAEGEKPGSKERKKASKLGLTVPEYRTKLAIEENQDAISAKIAKLSKKEKKKYEERAIEKKESLEEYVLGRIQKKEAKRTTTTNEDPPLLFFEDTVGDKSNLEDVKPEHRIDPDQLITTIWEGRDVESLSKTERKARRKWMRENSGEKNEDIKTTPTREETEKQTRQALTDRILREQGLKSDATKEQRSQAKQMAKRILEEEKDEETKGEILKHFEQKKWKRWISEKAKAAVAGAASA